MFGTLRRHSRGDLEQKQYYFLHLPKCAGTTVLQSLSRIGKRRIVVLSDSSNSKLQAQADFKELLSNRRQSIDEIDLVLGHNVFYGMHTIGQRLPAYSTFVRNPIDRYVSHFRYLRQCAIDVQSTLHAFAKKRMVVCGKVLRIEEYVKRQHYSNVMTHYLASAIHPDLSTKRWQIDDADELLELAKSFLEKMRFIGIVESIDSDLPFFCKEFGLRPRVSKANQSKQVDPELDCKLLNDIAELNQLDQQLYDYALELRTRKQSI